MALQEVTLPGPHHWWMVPRREPNEGRLIYEVGVMMGTVGRPGERKIKSAGFKSCRRGYNYRAVPITSDLCPSTASKTRFT